MKVLLEIKDELQVTEFMDLIDKMDYIDVLMKVKDKKSSAFISGLVDSFNDIKQYEAGVKKLKTAKELLNEL
ncbi:MAG: hypothetical protein WAT79_04450 [Saprospiraceae bacterium]